MDRNISSIPFERYADDMICHCVSMRQALWLRSKLEHRFGKLGLMLHPDKTRVVYCKDSRRIGQYSCSSFDFLGFTFRGRRGWDSRKNRATTKFLPAISDSAMKKLRGEIKGWKLGSKIHMDINAISNWLNPIIRGWSNYYGKFYGSVLHSIWRYLNHRIVSWINQKFKSCRRSLRRAWHLFARIKADKGRLFAHW